MQNVPPAIYDFAVWLKFGVGAVDFSAIGGNQIGIFNDSAIVADASTNVSITASYLSPE